MENYNNSAGSNQFALLHASAIKHYVTTLILQIININ